ncbi:helix-turn-helix transcriptional regulator [Peptococcaceae bacterium 1198_IL3148]
MSLPKRIKELRARLGISQEALAKKLELSVASVASYEIGRVTPSIEVLVKMADVFGVSIDYLLERTNDEPIIPLEISFLLRSLPAESQQRVVRYLKFFAEDELNH